MTLTLKMDGNVHLLQHGQWATFCYGCAIRVRVILLRVISGTFLLPERILALFPASFEKASFISDSIDWLTLPMSYFMDIWVSTSILLLLISLFFLPEPESEPESESYVIEGWVEYVFYY